MAISCIDVVLALTLAFVEISIPVGVQVTAAGCAPVVRWRTENLGFTTNRRNFFSSVSKLGFSMHRFISRLTHHVGHLYIDCKLNLYQKPDELFRSQFASPLLIRICLSQIYCFLAVYHQYCLFDKTKSKCNQSQRTESVRCCLAKFV